MIRNLDYYFCKYGDPKRDHFIRSITVAYDTGEETTHVINMYCPTNNCLNNALEYWAGACARGRNGTIEAAQICHVPRKMTDSRTFYMMHDGTIVRHIGVKFSTYLIRRGLTSGRTMKMNVTVLYVAMKQQMKYTAILYSAWAGVYHV